MKKQILSQENINIILKYCCVYSCFIISIIFNSINNTPFSIAPDIGIILIFFLYNIWFLNKSKFQAPINLFLFGAIIDTYTFMPIGLTSLTLLMAYKITNLIKMFLVNDDFIIFFIRDCFVFIFLFFIIKWFLFSYYMENFYSFKYVFWDIVKNIFYCILFRLIYFKFKKNV